VGAPLVVAQTLIGYLAVDRHTVGSFTPAELELIQAFAHQVAQTIYNARLYSDLRNAQAQLIQRERLAALGQMAATVAHELRNPLMGIRMGVEYFVRDVTDTAPQRRAATLMQANIDRIDRIVDDILYVARAPEPVLSPGLLRTVIEDELARWELSLAEKHIQCETHLAADLPPVLLDPDQMARLFTNLISNSLDALAGKGTIHIRLFRQEQFQVIIFADNGPGLSLEHVARVFEPFFTTKSRGTGLGLSIVKQIVEDHRGTIQVWSQVGEGTRFTISLPQMKEDTDA
jgi:two-component system sensor histidine kinase HydH